MEFSIAGEKETERDRKKESKVFIDHTSAYDRVCGAELFKRIDPKPRSHKTIS